MNFIGVRDPEIRFTGRWNVGEKEAVTTAPGAYIELAFGGEEVVLMFDTELNRHPYPHLWIMVDNGAAQETAVDRFIRINAPPGRKHYIKIIYKSAVEIQHRWYEPLEGKITFLGAQVSAKAELPRDDRKVIEFLGDSITEGVLIDEACRIHKFDQWNRPYQDDAAATYAYLTAQKLGLRPIICGYGAVGILQAGCGSVPKAIDIYPFCYFNMPLPKTKKDYIVMNYGANDSQYSAEQYAYEYKRFIEFVRNEHPEAKIIVLSAFCGAKNFQK